MNKKVSPGMERRLFLTCLPAITLAGTLLAQSGQTSSKATSGIKLWDPLTEEEEKKCNNSKMASSIVLIKGYSCSESIFLASLKYLKKPEDLVAIAGAFGGGLGHKDLCGLLTGGMMSIGLAAGMIHSDRKAFSQLKKQMVNQYWDWWQSHSPLHCSEMRSKYKKDGFHRMKKRVACKIEELIQPAKKA